MKRGHDDRWPYNCQGISTTRSYNLRTGELITGTCHAYGTYTGPDGKHYCSFHLAQAEKGSPEMTLDAIALEREALTARLAQLAQREAELAARPKEPLQEDAVVWFQKTFGVNTRRGIYDKVTRYTYLAVRAANGRWYTTARMSSRVYYTWSTLLDFIYSDEDPDSLPQIWVATSFEEVL